MTTRDEVYSIVQAYNSMVSKLSESSRKLAAAERDKAWSEMARQVAHEIKNPLTPMMLQVQRVRRLKEKGDPRWIEIFDEASSVLLEHIDILAKTAEDFSTFAKLYSEEPVEVDLDKMLQSEVSMFDNRSNITIGYLGLSDARVLAPKPQLTRVFVNLLNNAIQAIGDKEGGRIGVSLRLSSTKEGCYDIVFEDNGPGVAEKKNVERLFTPNFTTKDGGSGLGLAICRNILERSGATISYSRSFALGGHASRYAILFLAAVDLYRTAGEAEVLPQLVLQEALVGVLYVLRKVAEEGEGRETGGQLGDVFHLHVLALPCRRRSLLDYRQHDLVELRRGNLA